MLYEVITISHLNLGYVKFDTIEFLILDEADRMLDIGFYDDIVKIISYLPKERQTLMFSATMAPKIRKLASQILHEPKEINIAISKPAEGVLQAAYLIYDKQKNDPVRRSSSWNWLVQRLSVKIWEARPTTSLWIVPLPRPSASIWLIPVLRLSERILLRNNFV